MIVLLDTNAFSDLIAGQPQMRRRLTSVSARDRVVICTIVRGEIQYGIGRLAQGRTRHEIEAKSADLFSRIPCEAIPAAAGDHYATVKLTQQQRGLSLDENDLWIAATALALGAVLVSRDSDFQGIDGLTVEDWSV